ncbi:MAG: hypothetical protein RMJ84_12175, partial [Sandaracinaceae bacterium]|nr:hypothetical protein [Sandaracinaceae bacterium]
AQVFLKTTGGGGPPGVAAFPLKPRPADTTTNRDSASSLSSKATAPSGSSGDGYTISGSSVSEEANVCMANQDYSCVLRLLGNGRARTPKDLAMVIEAQYRLVRKFTREVCAMIATLLERFPSSHEAGKYRQIHATQCQGM